MEDKYYSSLMDKIVPGRKYKIIYSNVDGKDNPNNQKIHIRAFVDNCIVYRFWLKGERMWRYNIESVYYFESLIRCNVIFKDGFSKK